MKTLHLVRSPLLRRKKHLGVFKTKKKYLGKVEVKLDPSAINMSKFLFLTTSFSRHKKTVEAIVQKNKIENPEVLVNSNLQDRDINGVIKILKTIDDQYDHVMIIIPSTIRRVILKRILDSSQDISLGNSKDIEFNINSWTEFDLEHAVV